MTKTEFQEQFKRLRVAGYRLPVFDGITIADVIAEWYGTFGTCSKEEFSAAIDKLKQVKTDTFWPATGELWALVYEVRKAHRIRLQSQQDDTGSWSMSDEDAQEFLTVLRECKQRVISRMTMPHAEPQTPPQAVLDAEEIERENAK